MLYWRSLRFYKKENVNLVYYLEIEIMYVKFLFVFTLLRLISLSTQLFFKVMKILCYIWVIIIHLFVFFNRHLYSSQFFLTIPSRSVEMEAIWNSVKIRATIDPIVKRSRRDWTARKSIVKRRRVRKEGAEEAGKIEILKRLTRCPLDFEIVPVDRTWKPSPRGRTAYLYAELRRTLCLFY